MLFNSYAFILGFLPLVLAGFIVCGHLKRYKLAAAWLTLASLFYYGWWDYRYLVLILGSVVFNFGTSALISRRPALGRAALFVGVGVNLGALGYFKYANFFVANLASLLGSHSTLQEIVLPLAISFFTFQQIAFLVDTYRGEVREYDFLHYCLFVTFFPQLIAGPIVHHKEMMPQFDDPNVYRVRFDNIAIGSSYFLLGLFKKVVIADKLALYASPVFQAAEQGTALGFLEGWGGVLAYTLQLYFDFSGYADMAIGAGKIFGIVLPLNFNSPYKAANIIDFWRRWHISLSTFLRDYLYIPLGGNRKGPIRRYVNLGTTMLLGGLWHGAGWNFVIWGGLHGSYLVVNNLWREFLDRISPGSAEALSRLRSYRLGAWATTHLAVVLAWVFFRAESSAGAVAILAAMFGFNGIQLSPMMPPAVLEIAGAQLGMSILTTRDVLGPFADGTGVLWLVGVYAVAVLFPNTQQIFANHLVRAAASIPRPLFQWRPSVPVGIAIGIAVPFLLLAVSGKSEFIYYQF